MPNDTSPEVDARGAKIAVLPIGSFEQHGSHLPLTTDTAIACVISQDIAASYNVFALPPVTLSCSHEHHAWKSTVSISSRTLLAIIDDVYISLSASGLDGLILVNAHGGNYVLSNVVQEGCAQGKRLALFPTRDDWKQARTDSGMTSTDHEDMHGGELETSILLHSQPDLVRAGYENADSVADDRRYLLTLGMQRYTESGIIGRPSLATAEKGKIALDSLTRSFAGTLDIL